ncbi:MAG: RAD55 family ATPase [Candidatus Hodarchaeales archaeon]|jgi:KaiC/GvpD/RAD55 family RecA-like ATPase
MPKKKKASFFEEKTGKEDKPDSSYPPGTSEEIPSIDTPQIPSGSADQMALMTQMMQTMQSMMSAGAMPGQWESSSPFQPTEEIMEAVPHDIIIPKTLERGIVTQKGLNVHPLYSKLFLNEDNTLLDGIPKGCTCTLTGPAYSGKTRSALEMIVHAVMNDIKTAYVVAEEGFFDIKGSGRNDLFSRFLQIAEKISGLSEKKFRKKYDDLYVVIPNQYHKGKSWEEFIRDYRYAVEELECKFTIIDSINMLDPSKLNTVDNLNSLKTYNHEKGITCVVIGQVKDTGQPQGGEALFHTSEVALHISKKSMTSKALAEIWGAKYRDVIPVINARSKVCHTLNFPVKISFDENGMIRADTTQPSENEFPAKFWD